VNPQGIRSCPNIATGHVEHGGCAAHTALVDDPFRVNSSVSTVILAVIAATVGSLETLETAAALGDKNAAGLLQNEATGN
jgi:hypothetical protein